VVELKILNQDLKWIILFSLLFLGLGYVFYRSFHHKRTLNVNRNEVTIRSVNDAYFEDFITFQAKVEPLHSTLINNIEGGRRTRNLCRKRRIYQKGRTVGKVIQS